MIYSNGIVKSILYYSLFILLVIACNDSNIITTDKKVFSVDGLYVYCKTNQSNCEKKLACENELVFVKGTIQDYNIFPSEHRLLLFDVISDNKVLQINTISKHNEIFQKLKSITQKKNPNIIKIKARIHVTNLPTNGSCQRGLVLNLSNEKDLSIID